MNKIRFSVGQASGIAVQEVNADATTSVASGGASVFAGLVIARRGKIGAVLRVTADNYESVLGAAIHPRSGAAFEPLRHVATAVNGGDGYVVRVAAPGMKIPALSLMADKTMQQLSVVASNFAPSADPALAAGAAAMIYIEDGDASANRTLSMETDTTAPGFYILTLKEVDAAGGESVLESHQISFNTNATSDMGSPAFLPTALENGSTRLRALVADDVETQMQQITEGFEDMQFSGGTDGDLSAIATADYTKALTVLRKSMFTWTVPTSQHATTGRIPPATLSPAPTLTGVSPVTRLWRKRKVWRWSPTSAAGITHRLACHAQSSTVRTSSLSRTWTRSTAKHLSLRASTRSVSTKPGTCISTTP